MQSKKWGKKGWKNVQKSKCEALNLESLFCLLEKNPKKQKDKEKC